MCLLAMDPPNIVGKMVHILAIISGILEIKHEMVFTCVSAWCATKVACTETEIQELR